MNAIISCEVKDFPVVSGRLRAYDISFTKKKVLSKYHFQCEGDDTMLSACLDSIREKAFGKIEIKTKNE